MERLALIGIRMLVWNGNKTWLWEDLWLGDKKLMDLFLRLYSISLQQRTPVAECGVWDGSNWIWNLVWRRQFFTVGVGSIFSDADIAKSCSDE